MPRHGLDQRPLYGMLLGVSLHDGAHDAYYLLLSSERRLYGFVVAMLLCEPTNGGLGRAGRMMCLGAQHYFCARLAVVVVQ